MIQQALAQGLMIVLLVSAVPLIAASCGGLFISIIQAATQIQEQTVSYLFKFLILSAVAALGWNYFLESLITLMQDLFKSISFIT